MIPLIRVSSQPRDYANDPHDCTDSLEQERPLRSAVVVVIGAEETLGVDDAAILVPQQGHVGEASVAGVVRKRLGGRDAALLAGEDVGVQGALLESDIDLKGPRWCGVGWSVSV